MNNRTVNNRVNVLPELGGSRSVQETQTQQINQALNTALNRTLPPFPALNVRNLDTLISPPSTYTVQDADRTITLVGTLATAKVQFPQAKLNAGRQLHLLFRNTPDAPSLSTAATGGTITAGVYFVVTTFLLTAGGETLASLPSLIQTMTATSTVTVRSTGGPTLSGSTAYQVYVGTSRTGPFYLHTGSGTAIGTDAVFTAPFATSGSMPPTSNRNAVLPQIIPHPGDHIEALPAGVDSAVYQADATAGVWFLASTSSAAAVVATSFLGVRAGYRWPSAGEDITLTANDYSIYGTSGQGCHDVTFPLAASFPGQYYIFTFPPSGSLIPTGSDTIDSYSGQTAAYQSDGVSIWRRMWSV